MEKLLCANFCVRVVVNVVFKSLSWFCEHFTVYIPIDSICKRCKKLFPVMKFFDGVCVCMVCWFGLFVVLLRFTCEKNVSSRFNAITVWKINVYENEISQGNKRIVVFTMLNLDILWKCWCLRTFCIFVCTDTSGITRKIARKEFMFKL